MPWSPIASRRNRAAPTSWSSSTRRTRSPPRAGAVLAKRLTMPTLRIRTQIILPFEVTNRLGRVMVFDARGRTILEISQPDETTPSGLVFRSGTDLSGEPIVKPVLAGEYDSLGDKFIGYRGSPASSLAAAGPVVLGDRVVGGVLVETEVA